MTVEEVIKKIKQARSQTKEYIACQSQLSIGLPKTRETYLKGKIEGYEYALSLLGNIKGETKELPDKVVDALTRHVDSEKKDTNGTD